MLLGLVPLSDAQVCCIPAEMFQEYVDAMGVVPVKSRNHFSGVTVWVSCKGSGLVDGQLACRIRIGEECPVVILLFAVVREYFDELVVPAPIR